MKKIGLLLCLLLGLAACGEVEYQKKEEVFATLEEAFVAHKQDFVDVSRELVDYIQIEDQYIAAFSEYRPSADENSKYAVGFVIYEETEDGFVLRKYANSYGLFEGGWCNIPDVMEWTEEDGTCIQYELKAQGMGHKEPMEEELNAMDFAGEVFEREGYYFVLSMEAHRGMME